MNNLMNTRISILSVVLFALFTQSAAAIPTPIFINQTSAYSLNVSIPSTIPCSDNHPDNTYMIPAKSELSVCSALFNWSPEPITMIISPCQGDVCFTQSQWYCTVSKGDTLIITDVQKTNDNSYEITFSGSNAQCSLYD